MKSFVPLMLIALVPGSCTKPEKAADAAKPALTQRQKDSILGQSTIPGARGVQKALGAQDSLNKRTRRIDSIGGDSLP